MKKQEERLYLEAFGNLRPDLRLSDIRESERPDFICSAAGATIGIEMTRFFFPSTGSIPPQAVNNYRNQLSRTLREEHAKRGLPPLHVTVNLLSEEKLLDVDSRQRLAAGLVDFIAVQIPAAGPHVEFEYDSLSADLIELGVGCVSVLRSASLTKPFWSLPYASFMPESHSSLIQGIISEKSASAPRYRKRVPSLWLLIVSGSDGLHSIIDFDRDVLTASYASDFDRIFLFRTFGSSVHELKKS